MWANNVPFGKCNTKRKWIRAKWRVLGLKRGIAICDWMHPVNKMNSPGIWYTFALLSTWKKKKSYLGQNLNILCWKKPESQGEFYFYCCLYYLSPQIISLGIGRKISRCYKILLCRYLQMHSIDVICHLKSQILTDVPWIRCTLNNAFSRYHAYDLFET